MINKFLLDHKDFSDIPYEDIDLNRQRDAKRLQVMEGYCRTSGCLRNYILEYFGEKRDEPCDNCGNCHREFTEMDMTEDAKFVINCVWETKGRYGLHIILGTLLGANRARLKEIGTINYKTYGVLKNRTEAELRLLISQLRLTIAREEGMPPYIIFSDKTLIDMSIKAPQDRVAMLHVSGVGEAKYEKYGERFIDAITIFKSENPDSVTSIVDESADEIGETSFDRVSYNRKKGRPDGAGAGWTEAEDKKLDEEYHSGMKISEIARNHGRTYGGIRARLKKHGLIK